MAFSSGASGFGRIVRLVLIASSCVAGSACQRNQTLRVSDTNDSGSSSLRAAIEAANSGRGAARIELADGTYTLSACGSDDSNAAGDLDVLTDAPLTIAAAGSNVIIRQTCDGERVLDDHGKGALTLIGVTVTGGTLVGLNPAEPAIGGGVKTVGDLYLNHVTLTANSSQGANGSLAMGGQPANGGAAQGGGAYIGGSLFATESTLSSNTATGGVASDALAPDETPTRGGAGEGGGVYVVNQISFTGGAVTQNRAMGAVGGTGTDQVGSGGFSRGGGVAQRVFATAPIALTNVAFSDNSALAGDAGSATANFSSSASAAGGEATGGALAVSGTLTAKQVTATNNVAVGGSKGCGSCGPSTASSGGPSRGGAFALDGNASIADGTFTSNRSQSGDTAFGYYSMAAIPYGYHPVPAAGGALWAGKDLTITGGSYSQNVAKHGAGLPPATDSDGRGGAISGASITISDATFTQNTADARGGAVDAVGTVVARRVHASENQAGGSGGGAIAVVGDATIDSSDVHSNRAASLVVSGVTSGGGVLVNGHLSVTDTSVRKNSVTSSAPPGAISTSQIFQPLILPAQGGGIFADSIDARAVTVAENSESSSYKNPASPAAESGGGGGIASSGTVSLVNSTISDNSVVATVTVISGYPPGPDDGIRQIAGHGAGVLAASVKLDQCTVADNANGPALESSQIAADRSLVVAPLSVPVCAGTVTSSSYDWVSDTSCALSGTGDQQGAADFLLGPLVDNGGPVPTRTLGVDSVLIDRIPTAACPVHADARGVARPQGSACDVGAVEATPIAGLGSSDLALSFSARPASIAPGADATWELTVANHGPNQAAPEVTIDVPGALTPTRVSANNGGSCTNANPIVCIWTSPLARGQSATIQIAAHAATDAVSSLTWHAELFPAHLAPPLDDDQADVTTPVVSEIALSLSTGFQRAYDDPGHVLSMLWVKVSNAGPSPAVGTPEQPIEIVFHPAPGVHAAVSSEIGVNSGQWQPTGKLVGSFAAANTPFAVVEFRFSVDGTIPAELGTVEFASTGVTPQSSTPVIHVAAADLEVRGHRQTDPDPAGSTRVSFEITNHGPGAAQNVEARLEGPPSIVWTAQVGSISAPSSTSFEPVWRIPALSPGQSVQVNGVWAAPRAGQSAGASVTSQAVDFHDNEIESIDLNPPINGFADLSVSRLSAAPGADANQRIIRGAIVNLGPATAGADANDPIIVDIRTTDARVVGTPTAPADWTCTASASQYASCFTHSPLPASVEIPFEFVLEGNFPSGEPQPTLRVYSQTAGQTPDPEPGNNSRAIDATGLH